MKRTFTKYPQSVLASVDDDYSIYYGNIAVDSEIKESDFVKQIISFVEKGTLNGYNEWDAMNFLGGYLRNKQVYIRDITRSIVEVWYNHPEIKNFDKLVRLGV